MTLAEMNAFIPSIFSQVSPTPSMQETPHHDASESLGPGVDPGAPIPIRTRTLGPRERACQGRKKFLGFQMRRGNYFQEGYPGEWIIKVNAL
jgi:hypothetical protein